MKELIVTSVWKRDVLSQVSRNVQLLNSVISPNPDFQMAQSMTDISPKISLVLSLTLPMNTGGNISALLTVTGSDTVSLTEVALIEGTGRTQINGSLQVQVLPYSALIIKVVRQTRLFSCTLLDAPCVFCPVAGRQQLSGDLQQCPCWWLCDPAQGRWGQRHLQDISRQQQPPEAGAHEVQNLQHLPHCEQKPHLSI